MLVYRNTKLAVIEAKVWNEPLTQGVAQAKKKAGTLAVRLTYATNHQKTGSRHRTEQSLFLGPDKMRFDRSMNG